MDGIGFITQNQQQSTNYGHSERRDTRQETLHVGLIRAWAHAGAFDRPACKLLSEFK